jgi:DNA-binding transcriptional regulator YiaG
MLIDQIQGGRQNMATKVKTPLGRNVAIPEGTGQPTPVKSPQRVLAASKVAAAQKPAAASKAAPPKAAREVRGAKALQVAKTRRELGITQEIFARMIGVSARSIAGWEKGSPINESSYRRVREMERLASSLKKVMKTDYIPQWLVIPNEGMGGISPLQALESGENDRFWRSVFLLGSGLPL